MAWCDNSKYYGEWLRDMRHGEGVYYLMEGHRYEGQFTDNKMSGVGRYVWPDDSSYEGEW